MSAESNGTAFATGALVGGVLVAGVMAGILFFSGTLRTGAATTEKEQLPEFALGAGDQSSQPSGITAFSTDAETKTPQDKPLVERDEDGIASISPFYGLSDSEKNAYWWEIAGQCIRGEDDERRFFLNSATMGRLARHYGCTPVDLLQFFKAGIDAEWREFDPPDG